MLKKISVKRGMILIVATFFLLFIVMVFYTIRTSNIVRDIGVAKTSEIMLEDQKAKIQVATHSIALSLGNGIKDIDDEKSKIEFIRKLIDNIRFEDDKSGYFMVYQNTTNIALPPKKELQGKDLGDLKDKNGVYIVRELNDQAKKGGGFVEYIWDKPGAGDVPKLTYAEPVPGTDMWVGTGVYIDNITNTKNEIESDLNSQAGKSITYMLLVTGILFLIGIGLCATIAISVLSRLNTLTANVKDIAEGEGDLTKRITINSDDEIGELGKWFNVFIDSLQEMIRRISENATGVDTSSHELNSISQELLQNASNTSSRASNVATASNQMTSNLNSVAAAMEESSANANMVAAAAEEMSSTINEIAQSAERARDVSSEAVGQAHSAAEDMAQLGEAADKIGKVTETITEISEQTNLLALNATIEAARAGEAGKGFAVVANEIKELAKQTADATLDIKNLIDHVQSTTEQTSTGITKITDVIGSVNETIGSIATAVEEQTATTTEIAGNINQTSQAIQEVNENVSQSSLAAVEITQDISEVSTSSQHISSNSQKVEQSAQELLTKASDLRTIVDRFKV